MCPSRCFNVGLDGMDKFFPYDMPHQNLSQVDWRNKVYVKFAVQLISGVLTILGADVLD